MMGERGLKLAHTTIMRWVQRYVPEFEKSWARYARKVGRSWRVDETCPKVRGRWVYLYRALYLPPTTGIMRMPATRTPAGGLIAATAAASAPPGSGAAGDWASSKEGNIPSAQSAATAALC